MWETDEDIYRESERGKDSGREGKREVERDRERNIKRESESLRFFIFIESFHFQARPKKKNEKEKTTWMVKWKKRKFEYTNS